MRENLDNRMNIGMPYPVTWDMAENTNEEIDEIFSEWLERNENNLLMFECFLDTWHQAELYDFMNNGTMKAEFNKYKAKSYQESFKQETGLEVGLEDCPDRLEHIAIMENEYE
jgi:hypothetical protein